MEWSLPLLLSCNERRIYTEEAPDETPVSIIVSGWVNLMSK